MTSPLYDTLLADIKVAMKARNTEALTTLRSMNAQIKDATINEGKEVSDVDVATVVAKGIKQRQESAEQFHEGGRQELADKEEREVELLRNYQPQQLSESEIEALVSSCASATGATSKKDIGKLMGALMPQVKGKADGKLVNQIVMRFLSE
jgi:uncharacterized protein YqeY